MHAIWEAACGIVVHAYRAVGDEVIAAPARICDDSMRAYYRHDTEENCEAGGSNGVVHGRLEFFLGQQEADNSSKFTARCVFDDV